jgi:hypothetical protein
MSRTHNALADPVTTDPDKYKVIFENDRVRVFDYSDKPGERQRCIITRTSYYVRLVLSNEESHLKDGNTAVREFKGGEISCLRKNPTSEEISERQTLIF